MGIFCCFARLLVGEKIPKLNCSLKEIKTKLLENGFYEFYIAGRGTPNRRSNSWSGRVLLPDRDDGIDGKCPANQKDCKAILRLGSMFGRVPPQLRPRHDRLGRRI